MSAVGGTEAQAGAPAALGLGDFQQDGVLALGEFRRGLVISGAERPAGVVGVDETTIEPHFDAVVAVARAAKAAGASKLGVVSAMGASANSRIFYSRVKGEMEEALAKLGYPSLIIARPSMLAGNRAALAQPERAGGHLGLLATRLLKPLIPANYRAIAADDVAQALIKAVQQTKQGQRVLLSGEMQ